MIATGYCTAHEAHPGQPRVLYDGSKCYKKCNPYAVVQIDPTAAQRWKTFENWRSGVARTVERGERVKLFREGKAHWILHFAAGTQWVSVGAQGHSPVVYTLMRKFHSFSGKGRIVEHTGRLSREKLSDMLALMERLDLEAP